MNSFCTCTRANEQEEARPLVANMTGLRNMQFFSTDWKFYLVTSIKADLRRVANWNGISLPSILPKTDGVVA